MNWFVKFLGISRNQKVVKKYQTTVEQINALESELEKLSESDIVSKISSIRNQLHDADPKDYLVEIFALVREAAKRTLGLRHFDVQLIGAMALVDGKVAEMGTGEGKTLVATLAACLYALKGRGVHVVTVNDYLAERDANWMRPIFELLGLSVGVNKSGLDGEAKRQAYHCDITYSTNNELGFDYLRDHMALDKQHQVMRKPYYAIVDEVDSILIDEARTPLIISGPKQDQSAVYVFVNQLAKSLNQADSEQSNGHYFLDEKHKQAFLTDSGYEFVEERFKERKMIDSNSSLYDVQNMTILHYLQNALRAHSIYKKDVDYVVQGGEIVIVDEFTGRTMAGRRWSDGLHQAVEAKEKVKIQQENQTLASITYQNYFRLYEVLSGMTGTAETESQEFAEIYHLDVIVIPPNRPSARDDLTDVIYMTVKEKYQAIVDEVKPIHQKGQPILIGTASIESSESLSYMLNRAKIKHQVLNAKQHEKEAKIIAHAGEKYAITIATNMAGRGTDIVLGGPKEKSCWEDAHNEVIELGGLYVIGAERNESRRIDNQLRGRSGRQGDPGRSRFFLAMEDSLMRLFASEKMASMMRKLGIKEGEAIEHKND